MNAPQTVKQLNAKITEHFHILESTRAYENFTFRLVGGDEEVEITRHVKMLTLALKGPVDLCCEQIWDAIGGVPFDHFKTNLGMTQEQMRDKSVLLFVREWFFVDRDTVGDVEVGSTYVYGRIGFWEPRYQKGLRESRMYKEEGQPIKKVLREKE